MAALVLLALVGAGSRTGARLTRPQTRGQWSGLAAIGVLGGSVPFVLFFEGLSAASSAQAAFLHKTLLVWVAVLAVVLLGERLSGLHLLPWVAIRGDLGLLTSMTADQFGWALLTGVLLAGYVGTWFAALQRAQAVDVTAVLVLAAPVTAGLNAVANGVPLGPQLDWLAVVLAGGALAIWASRRARAVPVAAANGIGDPLDDRVVEAYWVGNPLLYRVGPRLRPVTAGRGWPCEEGDHCRREQW